jgi:fumarylacetoacetase
MSSRTKKSWVEIPADSDFTLHNLPYGIFSESGDGKPRMGVAIGDHVLDLPAVAREGYFDDIRLDPKVFSESSLNPFMALGKAVTNHVRERLQELLASNNQSLRYQSHKILHPVHQTRLHMPVEIPDYTDFYSSLEHAHNVGTMFRGPDNALMPNWKHLPVAYHGRASSIVVSDTPIHRPQGQILPEGHDTPIFSASQKMDFELEVAFIAGKASQLGKPIPANQAEEHIFGFVLFNDWSARDIQKWEYVPLGPFLGKNFASSISPWVVPIEALEPFRCAGPQQDPPVLPYLQTSGARSFDIELEVALKPQDGDAQVIARTNFKHLYWNICQQLAHHTVNGCPIRVGDMFASGTISGPEPGSYGSMLELSWAGKHPIQLQNGTQRSFLQDGDTVTMSGHAEADHGLRIGFGEVRTQLLPPYRPS